MRPEPHAEPKALSDEGCDDDQGFVKYETPNCSFQELNLSSFRVFGDFRG